MGLSRHEEGVLRLLGSRIEYGMKWDLVWEKVGLSWLGSGIEYGREWN